jgi:hypothetical protein
LDDTGFGQLGCYGSPIATPNLDALTAGGLLYQFEPTGQPVIDSSKGSPGQAQPYVDGDLVGQAEFPVTTPVTFNSAG